MNLTRDRVRSIGWAFVLTICLALTVALSLRVNAVKGQVHEAQGKIVALKKDIQFLEVEFQARSNQQQLSSLNSMEFGFVAPAAGQYIEGERQLAALGTPRGPDAPSPIRMARAVTADGPGTGAQPFIALVSPVGGNEDASNAAPQTADPAGANPKPAAEGARDAIGSAIAEANFGQRLARIELSGGAGE